MMAYLKSTRTWCVREPFPPYQPKQPTQAKVMAQGYPPLKSKPNTPWRKIPWINLKGYWLEQAGFAIDTPFSIQVKENKIILTKITKPR